MPQLDKITFLSQFFWLSFFYLGFYFLIYKYFLPKMSRVLKFRKRKMNTSQQGLTNMGQESDKVGNSYQTLLQTGLTTCKSVFNQNFKEADLWLNKTVKQANQTKLKNTNQTYIQSLGERSISQNRVWSHLSVFVTEKTSCALLFNKLRTSGLKNLNYSTLGKSVGVQGIQLQLKDNTPKSTFKRDTATGQKKTSSAQTLSKEKQGSESASFRIEESSGKNKKNQNNKVLKQEPFAQNDASLAGKANKPDVNKSSNKANKTKNNKK